MIPINVHVQSPKIRLIFITPPQRPYTGEVSSVNTPNGHGNEVIRTPVQTDPPPDTAVAIGDSAKRRRYSHSISPYTSPYRQPQPLPDHDPIPVSKPVPKQARHSLPKATKPKPPPRPLHTQAPTRTQPTREPQPGSSRGTPTIEDRERIVLPKVARIVARVNGTPPKSDIQSEADFIIAEAAKRRQEAKDSGQVCDDDDTALTPPLGQSTTSSTKHGNLRSPPELITGQDPTGHGTTDSYGDDDEDEEDDFDKAFEKVQEAYRNGIQPHHNSRAPQERSVPIEGLEDADPPEWRPDQRPTVVLAPGRDRALPTDEVQRAHRLGFDGLTDDLATDALGFVNNVRVSPIICN